MDRTYASGAAGSAPTYPASPSIGYPTGGNPSLAIPATKPGPWWYYMISEEIRKVITDASLTPDGSNITQLSAAIQALIAVGAKLPVGTPLMWLTPVAPAWALVRDGSAITRATYITLFAALCPTRNGTTTNGSATVTGLSTTTDLYAGMPVEGTGISAGSTISSITSSTAIILSANATASGTTPIRLFYYGYGSGGSATTFGVPDDRGLFERGLDTGASARDYSTVTGTTTNASATVTGLGSTRGLYVGQAISGAGVPGGATIASITSSTAITISAAATASATVPLAVTGNQIGNYRADEFASHSHSGPTGAINGMGVSGSYGYLVTTGNTNATGGTETKPKARSYLPIIVF